MTEIIVKPFDWNDNFSEVAQEDFDLIQKSLSYGTASSIGMALAKLALLEKQGCKVEESEEQEKETGIKLDEVIERFTSNAEFERTNGNLQGCLEFRQLAEWLKELKENRNVLDKIRAEIEHLTYYWCEINPKSVIDDVLQIIDKYKAEVEPQERGDEE